MKTILIIIAGMADLPDPMTLRDTPLTVGKLPSLNTLASRGEIATISFQNAEHELSHKNALLSLLGYDLGKGEPKIEELLEFGLDNSGPITKFESLRPFVIPGFSGHGDCVTTSAWARGVAKCALLNPVDIYSPGSSDAEILETMAELVTRSIMKREFVLVYVDAPLRASLKGDFEEKVKSLERIDRHLITPIADFVWKSDLMINMALTTDLVTPWHTGRPSLISVPVLLYFNNDDWEGQARAFTETEAMLRNYNMEAPADLIRYLSNFTVKEEEER